MTDTDTSKSLDSSPVVRFYMAEDVRQELHGKVTAIGLYPDWVVLANMPNDDPEPSKEKPIQIRSLAFILSISNLSEDTKVSLEIEGNGEKTKFSGAEKLPFPGEGKSANIVISVSPYPIRWFGKRTMRCVLNDLSYEFVFEIRRSPEESVEAAAPTPAKRRMVMGKRKST